MSTKRSTRRNANIISESESNTEEISDNNGVSSDKAATAPATATHSSNPAKQSPVRRRRVPRPQFVFFRSLSLADFITLGNAACGTCSIFFCLNFLENARHLPYLNAAFILLPLALVFDICDGTVARWRKSSSIYGADLDSLADAVSFGVAPAVLGFTLGLRGLWDSIILSFFVCCVIGRLARFNVTAEQLSYGGNKVKYFQGFPAPTSLCIVLLFGILFQYDLVLKNLPFGEYTLYGKKFHPLSLIYLFWGTMNISELKIPKP